MFVDIAGKSTHQMFAVSVRRPEPPASDAVSSSFPLRDVQPATEAPGIKCIGPQIATWNTTASLGARYAMSGWRGPEGAGPVRPCDSFPSWSEHPSRDSGGSAEGAVSTAAATRGLIGAKALVEESI